MRACVCVCVCVCVIDAQCAAGAAAAAADDTEMLDACTERVVTGAVWLMLPALAHHCRLS